MATTPMRTCSITALSFGEEEPNMKANVLEAFGLAADTKFLKSKAVGSV
jgi:hypothetical protein